MRIVLVVLIAWGISFAALPKATLASQALAGDLLSQNAGCQECRTRWAQCRQTCNNNAPYSTPLDREQCPIICDTAGQACMQRFCQ